MAYRIHHPHRWDLPPAEAVELQRRLAAHVRLAPLPAPPQTLAGVDVSVRGDRVQTALVVVRLADLAVIEEVVWRGPVVYPYRTGLLSFREMPAILPALDRLTTVPDVFVTDSQGLAHPRRFGLACHLGVLLDRPAFGVAKTRLIGTHEPVGPERGDRAALYHQGERIGTVLRTRSRVRPVYVSIGHRITLPEAEALTLACARYRLPEPTRRAHLLSKDTGA